MKEAGYTVLNQKYSAKKKEHGLRKVFSVGKYEFFIIIILSFFIGQARVAGFFSLALIFMTIIAESNPLLMLISSIIITTGLIQSGNTINLLYPAVAYLGLLAYYLFRRKKWEFDLALFNASVYLLLSLLIDYKQNVIPALYFISIAEALLIYVLTYIGIRGFKQLINRKSNLTVLSLVTLFIFSSGFIIGLANINIVPVQLINIIVFIFLFSLGSVVGFNYTITAAALYGLVLANTGVITGQNVFAYLIAAACSSIFTKKHKLWMIAAAVLSLFLYSGLTSLSEDLLNTAFEMGTAVLVFLIVPQRIWSLIYSSFSVNSEINVNEVREDNNGLKQHLNEISKVFTELSATFRDTLPVENTYKAIDDFSFIFQNKVCGRCKRQMICWQQDRDDMFKRIYLLLKNGKERGYLVENTILNIFADNCPFINQLISSVKASYEIHQVNEFWRNRLKDKQEIVSEQLAGIAEIVDQFSEESTLTLSNEAIVSALKSKAAENDIDLYRLEMHSNINSETSYFIAEMEDCCGNYPCQGQFLDLLNAGSEYTYRVIKKECGSKLKEKPCRVIYGPVGEYRLSMSRVLKACSGDISGDSFLYKGLKDGKDLIVISDGMGVGKKAAAESKAAINLLESIIDAGFDQKLAIKTINSALYLRNQEESFTTLDICIFDTFSGELTFNKIGAVASYIKRGWELIKVDSASLPAGILDSIEIFTKQIKMEVDDFIIMFTDGMLDAREDIKDKDEWLRQLLQNSSFDNPEDMLEYILDVVINANEKMRDDMTIVVVKIEEVSKKRRKIKALPRISIGERG